jgi:hypothetical protein
VQKPPGGVQMPQLSLQQTCPEGQTVGPQTPGGPESGSVITISSSPLLCASLAQPAPAASTTAATIQVRIDMVVSSAGPVRVGRRPQDHG